LTVLNTQVSYALSNADPAARDDALRGIRDGVQQGIRLVNQLLLLFTAEAGAAQPLRQAEVDLAEVVQRVLEELAALAQARNIDLGFERTGDAATVRGTPSMLHELVANLVDNAIRYTPPGGVVTAAILGSASGVTLRVEDNGPGIQPTSASACSSASTGCTTTARVARGWDCRSCAKLRRPAAPT